MLLRKVHEHTSQHELLLVFRETGKIVSSSLTDIMDKATKIICGNQIVINYSLLFPKILTTTSKVR